MIKGFMGRTHALLSIMLICLCMLIPLDFFKTTVGTLPGDVLLFIVSMIVTAGGALLPDLDNCQSSAGHTLGPVGSIVTTFMQSTSSIFWDLLHGKGDQRPPSQHRYFWHTLVAGAGISCLFIFGLSKGEDTIINSIKAAESITKWLQGNIALAFFVLFLFVAILIGSDAVVGRIVRFFKGPKILNYILPALFTGYIFFISMSKIRILGICLGFGYVFHCIEDCFADKGVPILWPLPIKGRLWKRIKPPLTIQTGSIANNLLDTVVAIIDIVLIILVFSVVGAPAPVV